MPTFASKQTPADDKLRGGYYTPDPIAQFLARWVAEAGPSVLEPSCGDGSILAAVVEEVGRHTVTGIELLESEAAKATARTGAEVITSDFFSWFTASRHGTYDSVAGNPPYIRFGSWQDPSRAEALDLMRTQGMRPTRLTNAWVPFVVASVLAARPGGRIGLVLPAELLQVGYAASLRSYLVDTCAHVTIVSFNHLVFPGIQQEVVLCLAERGQGPAKIRTVEVRDSSALAILCLDTGPATRAALHEREKWTKYYLEPSIIEVLRTVRADPRLSPLSRWAEVDVGVVSGRNSFFCLTAADVAQRGLKRFTVPLVSRSQQVFGLTFTPGDLADQDKTSTRTRLLALDEEFNPARSVAVAAYLAEGEDDGVPTGYKCRIRRHWWRVPSVWVPDGFMLRQISTHPRLIGNTSGATSTDTVHRVRVRDGVAMDRLAVAAYNSATFALSEVVGRSYGGGILELEPSEAEELPIPDSALVPDWLLTKADELVREHRIEDALVLVDQVLLVDSLGFDPNEVATLRAAWVRLRDRRTQRKQRI